MQTSSRNIPKEILKAHLHCYGIQTIWVSQAANSKLVLNQQSLITWPENSRGGVHLDIALAQSEPQVTAHLHWILALRS